VNLSVRSPHRAWIEIDHSALAGNVAVLQRLAGEGRGVIGVVKANAYGHGAIEVSRTLLRNGIERLAVATLGEGLALRAAGIEAPILILWGLGDPEAAAALAMWQCPHCVADLHVDAWRDGLPLAVGVTHEKGCPDWLPA